MYKIFFVLFCFFFGCCAIPVDKHDSVADDSSSKACPQGWNFFNFTGSCYKLFTTPITWSDAEDICKTEGAHLTSIHTQEEGIFVAGLNGAINPCDWQQNAWIGHYTEDNNAHWHWTDGSNFNYANWYPSEPDFPGQQNCGLIQSEPCSKTCFRAGDFQNCPCNTLLPKFVCKKMPSQF